MRNNRIHAGLLVGKITCLRLRNFQNSFNKDKSVGL